MTELYLRGVWQEASALAEPLLDELSRSQNPHFIEVPVRIAAARMALAQDDEERADEYSQEAVARGRSIGDLQVLYTGLVGRVVVQFELGRDDDARELFGELVDHARGEMERTGHLFLPWPDRLTIAWLSVRLGSAATVAGLLKGARRWQLASPWTTMIAQVFRGDIAAAADLADERVLSSEAAYVRLKGGVDVEHALDFYRRAGATRYVAEAENLVAKSA